VGPSYFGEAVSAGSSAALSAREAKGRQAPKRILRLAVGQGEEEPAALRFEPLEESGGGAIDARRLLPFEIPLLGREIGRCGAVGSIGRDQALKRRRWRQLKRLARASVAAPLARFHSAVSAKFTSSHSPTPPIATSRQRVRAVEMASSYGRR